MPRYRIETTTMVRRHYEIEAADQGAAEEAACNADLSTCLVSETDLGEDVDYVELLDAPSPRKCLYCECESMAAKDSNYCETHRIKK